MNAPFPACDIHAVLRWKRLVLFPGIVGVSFWTGVVFAEDGSPVTKASGSAFRTAIDQPVSGSWSNVELRELLNRISDGHRVALILDRRVDPSTILPISLAGASLKDGLRGIVQLVGAELSIADPVLYAGPPPVVSRLRTLIELRTNELKLAESSIPMKRQNELLARHIVSWKELDSPAEILQQVVSRYGLTIRNPNALPHDLWAANSLPPLNAIESLSLVLNQFDLTFAWKDGGRHIEIVPVPEIVLIEKRHRPKGHSADETLKQIRLLWPKLDARVERNEIVVRGFVEAHDFVAALINGTLGRNIAIVDAEPPPIKQRRFTLKIERVPVRVLMGKLEESDIEFEFNEPALATAGISLDEPINLEVEKVSPDEFFRAVFDPLKLKFEIDDYTVKLTPAR